MGVLEGLHEGMGVGIEHEKKNHSSNYFVRSWENTVISHGISSTADTSILQTE